MEILIGRNSEVNNLIVYVNNNGKSTKMLIGDANSVPQTVSRCFPEKGVAHCKLNIEGKKDTPIEKLKITIENLKSQNTTYVDNIEISKINIAADSTISLGPDKYKIELKELLKRIGVGEGHNPDPDSMSIAHLKPVWEKYEQSVIAIKGRAKTRMTKRLVAMSVTTVLTAISALLFSNDEGPTNGIISFVITLISALYLIKVVLEKDTSMEDEKAAAAELFDNYRCPNPKCHHYLEKREYKVLADHGKCPYCQTKWRS